MSPTAQAILDRPTTVDVGVMSGGDFVRYRLRALNRAVQFASARPDLFDFFSGWDMEATSYLPYSRRSENWRLSTTTRQRPVERLIETFDLDAIGDSADYLFGDSVPESVPPEWIAELENYRSVERGFVLPWNEDPPRDDVDG